MNPLLLRLLPFVISVVVGFGLGWQVNGWRWESKYQALEMEYNKFRGGVAALGEQAKARNAVQALNDLKAKEHADEQNRIDRSHAATTIARLRDERARAGGGTLPPAPTGSSRPDLACYTRPDLERAYGSLVAGVRSLADEGTAATVDLNTAKTWALKLKLATTLKE